MSFFKQAADKIRAERLSHVRPEIQELANRGNVTYTEYRDLRMNSWEQEHIWPALTDAALVAIIKGHILPHCSPKSRPSRPCITYDESLIHLFMPTLLDRFEKMI